MDDLTLKGITQVRDYGDKRMPRNVLALDIYNLRN